jgi:uncharacterized protein DUF3551
MRTLATLAVVATMASFTHAASAQGTYYPWCARYSGYTYNCGFTTWQQCQANISGMGGICYENPMPPPTVQSRARGKRKQKRTH